MQEPRIIQPQSHVRAVRTFRSAVLLVITLLACETCYSQHVADSLRVVLGNLKEDTAKITAYYAFGSRLKNIAPDSALAFYDDGRLLAVKLNDRKGQADFSSNAIQILNNQGKFREALEVARESLAIFETLGSKKDLAKALLNVGSEWHYLSDFQTASEYYLRALAIMDEIKDKYHQRILGNNLASIFINLNQYDKGKSYAERSLAIARELGDDYAVSSSMFNVAAAELYLKQDTEALEHYRAIEAIGVKTKDYIVVLDGWLGIADVSSAMKRDAMAETYYKKVVDYSKEMKAPEYEMYAYMGVSDVYIRMNKVDAARKAISEGITLASTLGSNFELKDLYLRAANLAEQNGLSNEALQFRKKFETLSDSVAGEKSKINIDILEAKYESVKKASTIKELEADKEIQLLTIGKKNTINFVLAVVISAVLVIALLGYRNYRQKQLLQSQRIGELEKEKQLAAAEAVLKGEEQERVRTAKDLHDGLGSLLSSVKMDLQHLSNSFPHDREVQFGKSIEMVDNSIKEMRRIAHNMMPESLSRFGLDTALADFCHEISQSGSLKVRYQSLGLKDVVIEQLRTVAIYRIVQELINNTIKHANATEAIVQISHDDGRISLTVEDNGHGFDTATITTGKGIGWTNIKSRVELLKGSMDMTSTNEGTSFHLEMHG